MIYLLVGFGGVLLGAGIVIFMTSSANRYTDALMFKTLQVYDFETKTRYVLVPYEDLKKSVPPNFRVVR